MIDSNKYWKNRYAKGGNSGAGSYNQIAEYKGNVINNIIKSNNIESIFDFGVGDGNQLKYLKLNNVDYHGFDISNMVINNLKIKYDKKNNYHFYLENELSDLIKCDLTMSNDVLYHLLEDSVFKLYMDKLFELSLDYVLIYSPDYNKDYNNHVKYREFTPYIKDNHQDFELIKHYPNPLNDSNTNADFYLYRKK